MGILFFGKNVLLLSNNNNFSKYLIKTFFYLLLNMIINIFFKQVENKLKMRLTNIICLRIFYVTRHLS
jgi:ABC-type amino acid transport system permease subunit